MPNLNYTNYLTFIDFIVLTMREMLNNKRILNLIAKSAISYQHYDGN